MQIVTCPSSWFVGAELIAEFIFALVTLFIAFYAYKVYKFSRQRAPLLFGLGFFSISTGYFLQVALNLLLLKNVSTTQIVSTIVGESVHSGLQLSIVATVLHIIFMTFGLGLLSYVTLKERGTKIFLLIMSLAYIALIFSFSLTAVFYVITSIFLLFMTAQHYQRHGDVRSYHTFYVFMGFGLLFLGQVQLALSNYFTTLYVSGVLTVLAGYLLLLWSLLRTMRK